MPYPISYHSIYVLFIYLFIYLLHYLLVSNIPFLPLNGINAAVLNGIKLNHQNVNCFKRNVTSLIKADLTGNSNCFQEPDNLAPYF